MSIKKTETDIREDIKKMEEELMEAIEYSEKYNFKEGIKKLVIIHSKIEYAKTLIDY